MMTLYRITGVDRELDPWHTDLKTAQQWAQYDPNFAVLARIDRLTVEATPDLVAALLNAPDSVKPDRVWRLDKDGALIDC
jgi:hypothetical protein